MWTWKVLGYIWLYENKKNIKKKKVLMFGFIVKNIREN